jgi:hypothetical protein
MNKINSGVTSTTYNIMRSSATSSKVIKEYTALPTFCLMIDILGAGQYMCSPNISLETFAKKTDALFQSCFEDFNVAGDFENDPCFGHDKSMRLSDTFVMWGHACSENGTADPLLEARALEYLLMASHHLMTLGFENHFAFRGAITYGQCIQDISSNAIIGAPWKCANDLEKQQEWAGITLHPTAAHLLTEEMKSGQLISRYSVPFKDNKLVDSWVIDWREWATRENILKTFEAIPGNNNKGELKKNNTLAFFETFHTS